LRWTGPRVGEHAVGPDGARYAVFRETGRRAPAGATTAGDDHGDLVILRAWFRLPWLGRAGSRRHRLFRRMCIVTVPLFSGLAGYMNDKGPWRSAIQRRVRGCAGGVCQAVEIDWRVRQASSLSGPSSRP
jgi:hypothetical protein